MDNSCLNIWETYSLTIPGSNTQLYKTILNSENNVESGHVKSFFWTSGLFSGLMVYRTFSRTFKLQTS